MEFSFYPTLEHSCGNVRQCPHLGGAAIGALVQIANRLRHPSDARIAMELYGVTFAPAALLGFETMLAEKSLPVVEDIRKKLASSDGAVHADETYWTTNGASSFGRPS